MIQPVKEKIILGIDPGTTIMGYGVLRVCGTRPEMIAMGIIAGADIILADGLQHGRSGSPHDGRGAAGSDGQSRKNPVGRRGETAGRQPFQVNRENQNIQKALPEVGHGHADQRLYDSV